MNSMLTSSSFSIRAYTLVSDYSRTPTSFSKNDFRIIKTAGNLILEKWLLRQSFPRTNCPKLNTLNEGSFPKEMVFMADATQLIPILTFLKKSSFFYYEQLIDISAIDNYKKELRFEVVYQLLSITHTKRLSLAISLAEGSGINSSVPLYPSAG